MIAALSRRASCAALLAVASLVTACSEMPTKPVVNPESAQRNWQLRESSLAAIDSFQLKGRLAESGLTGSRGDIDWTQHGESFDVRVSGPLGVGALAIRGDPRGVEIRTRDGVFATASPESFMQQHLGWSLPLAQLRYWVLGLPAPTGESAPAPAPALILDDDGFAQSIRQTGWDIEFDEYRVVGTLSLPRKLSLVNGDRKFRIVIDSWSGTP